MKKIITYIAVGLLVSSCSEKFDGDPQKMYATLSPHFLRVSSDNLSVNNINEPCKLSVASLDVPWKIESNLNWLTITPDRGASAAEISIVATPNLSVVESRTGIIYLKSESPDYQCEYPITISQPTAESVVQVSKTEIELSETNNKATIEITSNGAWTATADDWITLNPKTGSGNATLNISAEENATTEDKTGKVTVTMGGKTATINVTQKGKFFSVTDEQFSYSSKGGIANISVNTNDTWTAKTEDNASWLLLSQTSGTGSIELTATIADNPSVNPRSTNIIIETKFGQSAKVLVTQDARQFSVDATEVQFKGKGGASKTITVSTDGKFAITCSDTWISINQDENTFTINATVNQNPDPRSGTVTIELTDLVDGNLSATIDIMQLTINSSFVKQDYGEDSDFDGYQNTSSNIEKSDYNTDNNYDNASNNPNNTSSDIEKSDYNTDNNYDNASNNTDDTSSDITKSDFNTDENYDKH